MYLDRYPYLKIRDDDTKFLSEQFADIRIIFCRNIKTHEFEAWYIPGNSRPYKITTADNVSHAARLLRNRMQFDKMRATDLMKEIDEHNEKLGDKPRLDAVHEVRSTMKKVVAGRQLFIPPNPKLQRSA